MRLWTTPFSGYGLISNCNTPLHRDNNSQGPWYDCLTTIGDYEIGGRLVLKNLGLELDYASGTMVFLLGKLVRHGVSNINGNRVCIAQYMRDNVHERMRVRSADWPTVCNTFMSLPKYWFAFPMLSHTGLILGDNSCGGRDFNGLGREAENKWYRKVLCGEDLVLVCWILHPTQGGILIHVSKYLGWEEVSLMAGGKQRTSSIARFPRVVCQSRSLLGQRGYRRRDSGNIKHVKKSLGCRGKFNLVLWRRPCFIKSLKVRVMWA